MPLVYFNLMIIGLVVSILISVLLGVYCYYLRNKNQKVVELNIQRQKENETLEEQNKQLELKRENLIAGVQAQDNILKSLSATRVQLETEAETIAKKVYESKMDELMAKAKERENALAVDYENQSKVLSGQLDRMKNAIEDLESKQRAYLEGLKRQEEINANKDYYSLIMPIDGLDDISLLRDIQHKFTKKEAIDKLIWEVYYKPSYDALITRLIDPQSGKCCGIYKITDTSTGLAYIGQSVDIKERFRQHIKTALAYGGATNKLYQQMKKSGLNNFTFEILEEVSKDKLNEREVYWIDFYKTKEFGLNGTRGGS